MDPWGIDKEKRLHVRLGAQLWSELQSTLPECSVVIEDVEEYVLKAEKDMFSKIRPGSSWFEAYVSQSSSFVLLLRSSPTYVIVAYLRRYYCVVPELG